MKRNAVIRIVLWSIVLVVLLSILFTAMYVPASLRRMRYEETEVSVPSVIRPADPRTEETLAAAPEVSVPAGTADAPDAELQSYDVALDPASIRSMEIEWAAGSIVIQPMDITEIRISEEGTSHASDPMVWKVRDGKVAIQYSNKDHVFVFGLSQELESKDLLIQVPLDWQCKSLEIEAATASLDIQNLTIGEMEFDGASGTCSFRNCSVEKLDLDTASGDVDFQGSLNQLDCDAASANILLELNNVPKKLDLDTASGDLDVTLPEDAGFSVTMDTMSGEFTSDFETISRNGKFIAGDGHCLIEVDGMSGNVNIRKGQ